MPWVTIRTYPICSRDASCAFHHWLGCRRHPNGCCGAVDSKGWCWARWCDCLRRRREHPLRRRRKTVSLPGDNRPDARRHTCSADAAGAAALFRDGISLQRHVIGCQPGPRGCSCARHVLLRRAWQSCRLRTSRPNAGQAHVPPGHCSGCGCGVDHRTRTFQRGGRDDASCSNIVLLNARVVASCGITHAQCATM